MSKDLLELRLGALGLDVDKVRLAVELASDRGRDLQKAEQELQAARKSWNAIAGVLDALAKGMKKQPEIVDALNDYSEGLSEHVREAASKVDPLDESLDALEECLGQATGTAVLIEGFSQTSLELRCKELKNSIEELRSKVRGTPSSEHWTNYQALLDDEARPVFAEYVDFLGGLTLRDTGLDDRVCELTDALLSRFGQATELSLPLPARQAALGVALHSVILLGFPEWSIWGIPLVGHEVGLAYVSKRDEATDPELCDLIRRYASKPEGNAATARPVRSEQYVAQLFAAALATYRYAPKPEGDAATTRPVRSEQYVAQLFSDALATYTLGLSYACAALLLRLSPRYDKVVDPDVPTDIDRAQVILLTLGSDPPGGSFTEAVGHLNTIWVEAVRAHAGPEHADAAEREAAGASPEDAWLPEFTQAAVGYFRAIPKMFSHYDHARWEASSTWAVALAGKQNGPGWTDEDMAVLDVLTAAWRWRIGRDPGLNGSGEVAAWLRRGSGEIDPPKLALDVKDRWSKHRATQSKRRARQSKQRRAER